MTIDINISLERWPFRRFADDTPDRLVAKLKARRVTQAWAGNFDGQFHRDIAAVNQRLPSSHARQERGYERVATSSSG